MYDVYVYALRTHPNADICVFCKFANQCLILIMKLVNWGRFCATCTYLKLNSKSSARENAAPETAPSKA